MRLDERLVRFAAKLLPRTQREARLEEWLADLDGASELGMPRRDVSLAALRFAITEPSLREHLVGVRPRTWIVGGVLTIVIVVVGVPVAAIAGYAIGQVRGVVTEEITANGSTQTVHWKDYPGTAEIAPEEILAGPSLEQGVRDGTSMITRIQAELTAELGLTWADRPATTTDALFPAENRFGGNSMLYGINLPEFASTGTVTEWAEKERVLEIAGDVLAKYRFDSPELDQARWPMPAANAIDSYGSVDPAEQVLVSTTALGPAGQWFNVTILDSSKDPNGIFAEKGFGPDSITLFYGANALLREEDRTTFQKRLEPYEGYALPEPLED